MNLLRNSLVANFAYKSLPINKMMNKANSINSRLANSGSLVSDNDGIRKAAAYNKSRADAIQKAAERKLSVASKSRSKKYKP